MLQLAIDRIDRPPVGMGKGSLPGVTEAHVVGVAALGTRAVARGQGGGFVEEEQLCPAAGLHQLAVSAAELELAGDPAADLAVADNALLGIVEHTAVAGEQPTAGHGHDLAEGRYAIAERQRLCVVAADWPGSQNGLKQPAAALSAQQWPAGHVAGCALSGRSRGGGRRPGRRWRHEPGSSRATRPLAGGCLVA